MHSVSYCSASASKSAPIMLDWAEQNLSLRGIRAVLKKSYAFRRLMRQRSTKD
jgi:hypothetical protein